MKKENYENNSSFNIIAFEVHDNTKRKPKTVRIIFSLKFWVKLIS